MRRIVRDLSTQQIELVVSDVTRITVDLYVARVTLHFTSVTFRYEHATTSVYVRMGSTSTGEWAPMPPLLSDNVRLYDALHRVFKEKMGNDAAGRRAAQNAWSLIAGGAREEVADFLREEAARRSASQEDLWSSNDEELILRADDNGLGIITRSGPVNRLDVDEVDGLIDALVAYRERKKED